MSADPRRCPECREGVLESVCMKCHEFFISGPGAAWIDEYARKKVEAALLAERAAVDKVIADLRAARAREADEATVRGDGFAVGEILDELDGIDVVVDTLRTRPPPSSGGPRR